jgi:hypothetical protein
MTSAHRNGGGKPLPLSLCPRDHDVVVYRSFDGLIEEAEADIVPRIGPERIADLPRPRLEPLDPAARAMIRETGRTLRLVMLVLTLSIIAGLLALTFFFRLAPPETSLPVPVALAKADRLALPGSRP